MKKRRIMLIRPGVTSVSLARTQVKQPRRTPTNIGRNRAEGASAFCYLRSDNVQPAFAGRGWNSRSVIS